MATYNYECLDCLKSVKERLNIVEDSDIPIELYESDVLYETSHLIKATKKEIHNACVCPRCGGHNARKSMYGNSVISYVRGYGYLDRAGCSRDMNKYKLTEDDPYAQYRMPGEVEHIKSNLDKQGKHNPKTQYFTANSKSMEKAVTESVSKIDK